METRENEKWKLSDFNNWMHISVFRTIAGIGVLLCLLSGCRQDSSSLKIDPNFSWALTIGGQDSGDTVDLINIYQIQDDPSRFRSLSLLSRLQPTMKIQDRVQIRHVMSALREFTAKSVIGAYQKRDPLAYHIVFVDYQLKRVGYAIVRMAVVNGEEWGVVQSIQPGGGDCLYYNKPILKTLGVTRK